MVAESPEEEAIRIGGGRDVVVRLPHGIGHLECPFEHPERISGRDGVAFNRPALIRFDAAGKLKSGTLEAGDPDLRFLLVVLGILVDRESQGGDLPPLGKVSFGKFLGFFGFLALIGGKDEVCLGVVACCGGDGANQLRPCVEVAARGSGGDGYHGDRYPQKICQSDQEIAAGVSFQRSVRKVGIWRIVSKGSENNVGTILD